MASGMPNWSLLVPSSPSRYRHLVVTQLNKSLQVRGFPCLPPRCGTGARASQNGSWFTSELGFRNVSPPSAYFRSFPTHAPCRRPERCGKYHYSSSSNFSEYFFNTDRPPKSMCLATTPKNKGSAWRVNIGEPQPTPLIQEQGDSHRREGQVVRW